MADFPATGMPPMIGKMLSIAEWNSYIASYQFGDLPVTKLVLHHTWKPTVEQWKGLASMRGMQSFYGGKGWTSAPHIYVGPDGIWLFTPLREIGIHANAGNGGRKAGWYSIGVEMIGDYDRARPSGAVWEGTKAVIGGVSRKLGIAPDKLVAFHREYNTSKSCPGWAVTKDWVVAEVNGWLASSGTPSSLPAGIIGSPTPEIEHLGELLLDASYGKRGEGYNETWAFHLAAVQQGLGYPMAKSQRLDHGGKAYNFQPFARETLFCEIPNWGDVQRLSDLLGGAVPAAGSLGRALLDATYKTGGAVFHPEWAFHAYAIAAKTLGPPLAESKTVVVDGVTYSYQIYATDTIYNPGTEWSNINRLSALAGTADAAKGRLRDALLAKTYEAAGMQYRPDWAFHQLALKLGLGAPLGKSDPVAMGTAQYNLQVYATDTLYNLIPNWGDVKRLGELVGPSARRAVLSGEEDTSAKLRAGLPEGVRFDPELRAHFVARYNTPGVGASAYGTRSGSKISAIVLHGAAGPTEANLDAMTAPGADAMTHYYVADDARIYQLVSDRQAAFHAGMATWRGRRVNMNRISIGITVERPRRGFTRAQTDALRDLVATLRAAYGIAARDVLRWGDLAPGKGGDLSGLQMEQITR